MQIAYFINTYPAVSQTFIRREITALEKTGWSVERIALRHGGESLVDQLDIQERQRTYYLLKLSAFSILARLLSVLLGSPRRFVRTLWFTIRIAQGSRNGLMKHLAYFAEACLLMTRLRRRGIGHVHAHFGTNSTTVLMLCRMLGGPHYSFTVHGPEEFDYASGIALKEKIEHAKFVVGISSFGRSQLFRLVDVKHWPRIHIVRCGLPPEYWGEPVENAQRGNRFVCVGRLCEQKGQLLLLDAVAELRDQQLPVQLDLIGDGPMRAVVERRIAQLDLQDQVRLLGFLDGQSVRQHLAEARAFVLPSFAEGLPVVFMEALALRTPVIATFVAGIPELVDNACGWIVPAGSVPSLVQAMRAAALASESTMRQLGDIGRDRVREMHNVETEAAKLSRLFADSCSPAAETTSQEQVSETLWT